VCIAAIGVIWQANHKPVSTVSVTTQSPSTPAMPATSRKPYGKREAEDLIEALNKFSPLLTSVSSAVDTAHRSFMQYGGPAPSEPEHIGNPGNPNRLADRQDWINRQMDARSKVLEELQTLCDASEKRAKEIFSSYSVDMRDVAGFFESVNRPHPLRMEMNRYIQAIKRARNDPSPYHYLMPYNELFRQKLEPFKIQLDETKSRIDPKVEELRGYLR
jgi:hypothetical protein